MSAEQEPQFAQVVKIGQQMPITDSDAYTSYSRLAKGLDSTTDREIIMATTEASRYNGGQYDVYDNGPNGTTLAGTLNPNKKTHFSATSFPEREIAPSKDRQRRVRAFRRTLQVASFFQNRLDEQPLYDPTEELNLGYRETPFFLQPFLLYQASHEYENAQETLVTQKAVDQFISAIQKMKQGLVRDGYQKNVDRVMRSLNK